MSKEDELTTEILDIVTDFGSECISYMADRYVETIISKKYLAHIPKPIVATEQILALIDKKVLEGRIALLAKIANTEGWEETAWIYCTEPEIGISPNEFEKLRAQHPGLQSKGEK